MPGFDLAGYRRGSCQIQRPAAADIPTDGGQGTQASLSDVSYLGGEVLLNGMELVSRLISGASAPQRQYRQVTDLHDGIDDALSSINRLLTEFII